LTYPEVSSTNTHIQKETVWQRWTSQLNRRLPAAQWQGSRMHWAWWQRCWVSIPGHAKRCL